MKRLVFAARTWASLLGPTGRCSPRLGLTFYKGQLPWGSVLGAAPVGVEVTARVLRQRRANPAPLQTPARSR